jgi:hypothetical protein
MTIFVKRCISGADAFSAYACQNVIVVVAPVRSEPAVATVTATAETAATSDASMANLAKRIWCYLLRTLMSGDPTAAGDATSG